jgi:hypothetical protein
MRGHSQGARRELNPRLEIHNLACCRCTTGTIKARTAGGLTSPSRQRKAGDSNPHAREGAPASNGARPAVSGDLPTLLCSGPPGSRTPISCLQGRRLAVGPAAHREIERPGREAGPGHLGPRYRAGGIGLMRAERAPAPPEDRRGETRTPTPRKARAPEARASAISPPGAISASPNHLRNRECVGTESNRQSPKAGGLQPPGHAHAQPTHQGISAIGREGRPPPIFSGALDGFEPTTSTVTGWRALRAAPRGHLSEPATLMSSGGWNRTSGLRVQGAASLPAATAPDRALLFLMHRGQESNLRTPP